MGTLLVFLEATRYLLFCLLFCFKCMHLFTVCLQAKCAAKLLTSGGLVTPDRLHAAAPCGYRSPACGADTRQDVQERRVGYKVALTA